MKYQVGTFRAAGLEAKWTKTPSGAPIIVCKQPTSKHIHQRCSWWYCTDKMWADMRAEGIIEGFQSHTILGDIFSVTVAGLNQAS